MVECSVWQSKRQNCLMSFWLIDHLQPCCDFLTTPLTSELIAAERKTGIYQRGTTPFSSISTVALLQTDGTIERGLVQMPMSSSTLCPLSADMGTCSQPQHSIPLAGAAVMSVKAALP